MNQNKEFTNTKHIEPQHIIFCAAECQHHQDLLKEHNSNLKKKYRHFIKMIIN